MGDSATRGLCTVFVGLFWLWVRHMSTSLFVRLLITAFCRLSLFKLCRYQFGTHDLKITFQVVHKPFSHINSETYLKTFNYESITISFKCRHKISKGCFYIKRKYCTFQKYYYYDILFLYCSKEHLLMLRTCMVFFSDQLLGASEFCHIS